VLRSIERAFAVAPTSKRIVEDSFALPMALGRIIEHKGTVVEDEALRHRRRLAKQKTWESRKPNKATPWRFTGRSTPTVSLDLKAAIMAYSSYTSILPNGDARRFNLGTPSEVLRSIERAFAVSPASKRIVEDILALPMALGRIIEHKGIVLEDDALRHVRRLAKHKTLESLKPNKAPLKNKPRSFQRIETLISGVPSHPGVEEARKKMKSGVF